MGFFNKSGNTTSTSNLASTVFIKGDTNTDGSTKFITDENGITTVQERTNGVWNDSDFRISGNSLYIGRDLRISAAGHIIMTKSLSDNERTLVVHSHFNDNGSIEPEVPLLATKEVRIITQSDNTGEFTGSIFGYTVTPTSNQLISRIYIQTGSVPAGANIVVRAYVGTDNTGTLFFQKVIPSTSWLANSEIQIDIPGLLGYTTGKTIYGEYTSASPFSIKTNVAGTQLWRAVDRWIYTRERISYASPWSEKTWNKDDWCINGGKIYVCNQTGAQSGSFVANSIKWDLLSDLIAKVLNYKGSISVASFNVLTSAEKGDQYKLSDSGTLVGSVVANANDTVIIRTTFTGRAITVSDYDYFAESSDVVLQLGRVGGQQITGGTGASENLVLKSTEHVTKGKIIADDDIEPSNTNLKSLGSLLKAFLSIFTRKIESDDALDISAGGTDKNITLTASGAGTIIPASDVVPSVTNTRSIGSSLKVIKEIFVRKITSDDDLILEAGTGKIIRALKAFVSNTISTADGTSGYVTMNTGGTRSGFFEWKKGDNTRLGFMGDGEFDINLALENGANFKIVSTTGGFNVPVMTKAQRLLLTPYASMQVFQNDEGAGLYCYTNGIWEQISGLGRICLLKTSNQNLAAAGDITFATVVGSNISTGGNGSNLLANKTYSISGSFYCDFTGTSDECTISIVDSSNSQIANSTMAQINSVSKTGSYSGYSEAYALFTPTVDTTIKFRVTGVMGTATINASKSHMKIIQIS